MAFEDIFFTDSASFDNLEVSGHAIISGSSNALTIIGSGSSILVVSGSSGPIFTIDDYNSDSPHIFAFTSGTIDILAISQSQQITVSGSLVVTNGSGNNIGGITGSLLGTSSWAENALTASYVPASSVVGLNLSRISTGSITASVDTDPNNLFLIKSGSNTYFNIAANSNTTLYSNQFIIRNFITQNPILTISQSIVQFATQSSDPTNPAVFGGIWFTSTSMYVGLD